MYEVSKGKWQHQVSISDSSGDALADVNVGTYKPLQRGVALHITVGIVQAGVPEKVKGETKPDFKKIYIDQFTIPSDIGEPDRGYNYSSESRDIPGMVRHGVTCSYIQAGKEPVKQNVLKWTKFIIDGE